jgi:sterol desaturase/sphingolipid hydroxylase (fatty acid hydroxylase superfamily)
MSVVAPWERLSPIWLVTAAVVAAVIWSRMPRAERGGFFAFALPRGVYGHASFRADVRLWLANIAVFLIGLNALFLGAHIVTDLVAGALPGGGAEATGWGVVVFVVGSFLALELADYWHHRAFHEIGVLWEFHKVHHSAEVLTPVTAYREHPVDIITRNLCQAAAVGIVQGVLLAVIGGADVPTIAGVEMLLIPYLITNDLRHSHVWVSYGRRLSHVFSSPAQHQCHHGTDPQHIDINYGVSLSLWDWVFGTLYVPPSAGESVRYGLKGVDRQPHATLAAMYAAPFAAVWRRARTGQLMPVAIDLPAAEPRVVPAAR